LQRRSRGGEWNRLDAYAVEFHRRVRQGYHDLARAEPQRWVIVDAAQPPEQVQVDIRKVIAERLKISADLETPDIPR
jgi:dTMP kinase